MVKLLGGLPGNSDTPLMVYGPERDPPPLPPVSLVPQSRVLQPNPTVELLGCVRAHRVSRWHEVEKACGLLDASIADRRARERVTGAPVDLLLPEYIVEIISEQ